MTTHTNARPMPAVDPPRAEQWTIDAHRDANGHFTIRIYDGTITGDTVSQPIATVYRHGNAIAIEQAPALLYQRDALAKALEAAVKCMEAVSVNIPVHLRSEGISQAKHVAFMASHLAQHAKIARAALPLIV